MSHVAKIEIEIKDLSALKAACVRLGLEFVCDQQEFVYFGGNKGKCGHVIKVPGAHYEIGVARKAGGSGFELLWDPYFAGGLQKVLGAGAGKLKQAYAACKTVMEARRKGYLVNEQVTKNGGIRITLSGGRA